MKTPALCIFLLGSFLGSLAGMEEAFAAGGVYENYLRTSGNSPAQIQAEVNSRSLALELAQGFRPCHGNRLLDRLHGYLLRFGQRAADTFCRQKIFRHQKHQHHQKNERKITRMLHH